MSKNQDYRERLNQNKERDEEKERHLKEMREATEALKKMNFDARGPMAFLKRMSKKGREANADLFGSTERIYVKSANAKTDTSKFVLAELGKLSSEAITADARRSKELLGELKNLRKAAEKSIDDDETKSDVLKIMKEVEGSVKANANFMQRSSAFISDSIPTIENAIGDLFGSGAAGKVAGFFGKGISKALSFGGSKKDFQKDMAQKMVDGLKERMGVNEEGGIETEHERKSLEGYLEKIGNLSVENLTVTSGDITGQIHAGSSSDVFSERFVDAMGNPLENIEAILEESLVKSDEQHDQLIDQLDGSEEEKADKEIFNQKLLNSLGERKGIDVDALKGLFKGALFKSAIMGMLGGKMGAIMTGIMTLLAGGGIMKAMKGSMKWIIRLGKTAIKRLPLLAIFGSLFKGIADGWDEWTKSKSIGKALMATLHGFADTMIKIFSFGFLNLDKVNRFVSEKMSWLTDGFFASMEILWDLVKAPFDFVGQMAPKFWSWMKKTFKSSSDAIRDLLKDFSKEKLKETFQNFIDGVFGAIKGTLEAAQEWFQEKIDALMDKFGILKDSYGYVGSKISGLKSQIAEIASQAADYSKQKVVRAYDHVKEGVTNKAASVVAGTASKVSQLKMSKGMRGLLEMISDGEGTSDKTTLREQGVYGAKSGYDATYAHGRHGDNKGKQITEMTLGELREYQKSMLRDPSNQHNSSAAGKYQIIGSTLFGKNFGKGGLYGQMGLNDDMKFTPELQDKMAIKLLEGRGLKQFLAGKMTLEQFQDKVAKEWASVANSKGKGEYENLNNRVHTFSHEIQSGLNEMKSSELAQSQKKIDKATSMEAKSDEIQQKEEQRKNQVTQTPSNNSVVQQNNHSNTTQNIMPRKPAQNPDHTIREHYRPRVA